MINFAKDEKGDMPSDSYSILNRWIILSGMCWMSMETVMLDELKYVQLSHYYMRLGLCKLEMLMKGWKGMNFQLLIKFW